MFFILQKLFGRKCKEVKETTPQQDKEPEKEIEQQVGGDTFGEEEFTSGVVEDKEEEEVAPRIIISNPRRWSYASRREGSKHISTSIVPDEEVERLVNGLMNNMSRSSGGSSILKRDIYQFTFLHL